MDDDIDDELRRLFSDDRLDVHVTPDATDAVLRGADRRRRRRSAVATAFAVVTLVGAGVALTQLPSSTELTAGDLLPTSVPTSSSTPPPPSVSTVTETTIVTVNPPEPNPTGSNPGAGRTTGGSSTKPRTSSVPLPPPPEPGKVGKLALSMSEADARATGSLVEPGTAAGQCTSFATTTVPAGDAVLISPTAGIVRLTLPSYVKTQKGVGAGSEVADVKTAYPAATQNGSELLVEMAATPKWTYVFETDGTTVTTVRMRLNVNDCQVA